MRLLYYLLFMCFTFATSCIIRPVATKHYTYTKYYTHTLDSLKRHFLQNRNNNTDTLKVGWNKVNITPITHSYLAGYGGRKNKKFESVLDSIYIKTFVVRQGNISHAIISTDLLIFPMELRVKLEQELPKNNIDINHLYFTAGHSHNSAGGWGRRLLGRAIAGKYSKDYIDFLCNKIIFSFKNASQNIQTSEISYSQYATQNLVSNRLNKDDYYLDTIVRSLTFHQIITKKDAVWTTFSAHPTNIPSRLPILSADYTGYLCKKIKSESKADLVAFAAASVGSHTTKLPHCDPHNIAATLQDYADSIYSCRNTNFEEEQLPHSTILNSFRSPLYLSRPQFRISKRWAIAPFLFHTFFGKYQSYINVMQIENVLLIGLPCDFSGQLALPLIKYAKEKNIRLIVNSFNGGYIGYVTPDQYFDKKSYETRDMNLFGKYTGTYFSEVITKIIDYTAMQL